MKSAVILVLCVLTGAAVFAGVAWLWGQMLPSFPFWPSVAVGGLGGFIAWLSDRSKP